MPSNKKRLYIALYPSGTVNNEERKYHWAFLIGPKEERNDVVPGKHCHVKNSPFGWVYEGVKIKNVRNTDNLLARIVIAKVEDEERLLNLFRHLPVVQGNPEWRCRTWIASALAEIAKDGECVGTAELDWEKIEAIAREYVGEKTAGGRYESAADIMQPKPTWDMLENKESVS
ncbi:hypothetical protein N7466_001201 [Penicillium verhagenii]|uniref:uncharacterized protein n=1 Tax=Penicillium verhagenii TaxID=1562060 RepID=UPI002544D8B8|nr:uncharacterized protein N7466_001201 [Penicillium verhagenii]KAJ5948186.1 hypothetical protein N7466_001201 [Penicillium verhagenii]